MEITHNWKTYKWIGDMYWHTNLWWHTMLISDITWWIYFDYWMWKALYTYHTPEQLVKLGYMELITKPCDHKNASIWIWPEWWYCSKCWEHKYEENKPLVENALPLFDRSNEYKWYKMKIKETKPEENLEEAFAEDFPNTWGKQEEKPTECLSHWECAYMKNWNLLCTLCDKDCRIIRAEDKPDHDKAMEIPDVPLYQRENEWNRGDIEWQLELLTTAVNKLIKSHKK